MVGMSYRDPTTQQLVPLPLGCAGGGAPIGAVMPYAGATAPVGWHICDGTPHGSPALQSLLGSGNTPDLRGKFILAASATHSPKTTGGAETHTLTEAEMPSHNHDGATGVMSANQSHAHSFNVYTPETFLTGYAGAGANSGQGAAVTSYADIAHTHGIASKGGGGAHNNMPPFYAMVYIIKCFSESANGGITQVDADARYVNVSGDTMTGELAVNNHFRLSGALAKLPESADDAFTFYARPATGGLGPLVCANPTYSNQAATKGYVDTRVTAGHDVTIQTDVNGWSEMHITPPPGTVGIVGFSFSPTTTRFYNTGGHSLSAGITSYTPTDCLFTIIFAPIGGTVVTSKEMSVNYVIVWAVA